MSAYSCCLESHSKLSTFRGTAEWPGGGGREQRGGEGESQTVLK